MDLGALIVEQLEEDGTIRSFKMERQVGQSDLIVALPDEYDEPRDGPFHFHDPKAALRFSKGFAQCRLRRLGSRHFFRKGAATYHVDLRWAGLPTTGDVLLTYYALSLPKNAFPIKLSVTDQYPPRGQYRRTVTRDDQRRRYVVYLDCSPWQQVRTNPTFNFDLSCDFEIDPARFLVSEYHDEYSDESGRVIDEYRTVLTPPETKKIQVFFESVTNPNINIGGEVSAMGSHAKAVNLSWNAASPWERGVVLLSAIGLIVVLVVFAFSKGEIPDRQWIIIRSLTALAGAGFAIGIPGFLTTEIVFKHMTVRALGALAVFAIIWFSMPAH
jgi:hypothetical protein